ncbi:MAG: hypothetical protein U1E73_13980 [Planctomycetota bacterium]
MRLISKQRIDDGSWHRIEVAYDADTNVALLFVDDELSAHAELGAGGSPAAELRLGDNIGAHQPFLGDLDALEITAATTRHDLAQRHAPILTRAERERQLAALREQWLPRATPSLAAGAAADWPARRATVRAHVQDALGLAPPPPAVLLDVKVHAEVARDGVRLQRVSWVGFAGHRATGWLWLPDPLPPGRLPAVLCPHGHWQDGARHAVVQARCAAFAQFGWIALAVDSVHVEHVASGVNAVGAMTWHNQRALDLLCSRPDVDPARIAVTGASGGAQQAYYLMALEDRLAAAAPIVMACYLTEIVTDTGAHCGCNHTPRLAAGTDVPEMCAVFAPRPVFFGSVTGDWTHDFPVHGLPELTAHWQRLGGAAPGSRHGDEGHNYDRPMREAVYAFLRDALAPDDRRSFAEPGFRPFPLGELQALARTCENVQLDGATMAKEYLARRPRVASLQALAPRVPLADLAGPLRFVDGLAPTRGFFRRATVGDGVAVPVAVRDDRPDGDEPFVVVVDPRGEAILRNDPPAWLTGVPRVALPDPRPYGEWAGYRSAWQRNGLLLGAGEGYLAAWDTARVCQNLPGRGPVTLLGLGEAGVVAVLAAHLCPRITRVLADDLGKTYAEDGNRLPLCPELLRFRDLLELIATLPDGTTYLPVSTETLAARLGSRR